MIAAFVDDLLFRSKIRAAASHTEAAVAFLEDAADDSLANASLAIVDLDGPHAVALVAALRAAWPALRIVGFVSHVHAERIREARAAGATDVMARSGFVTALPSLLTGK
jgi:DNA-binding NarL/FixJ family response regulator